MVWKRLTAWTGGTVAGLAVCPATGGDASGLPAAGPSVLATTLPGLFRSTDGGRSWAPASSEGTVPLGEVIARSPTFEHDRTLFLGGRDGLYRSDDGGSRWRRILTGGPIHAVALSPRFSDDGLLFAGTAEDGILRSDDRGETWSGANAGVVDLAVLALALSPTFPRDRIGFAGTGSSLLRTRNGGQSWREVELGVDEAAIQTIALSPRFSDDRIALAGTESHGLLRSGDGGTTWETVADVPGVGVTAIAWSERGLAAATDAGIFVSDDGGERWRPAGALPGPVLSLAFTSPDAAVTADPTRSADDRSGNWDARSVAERVSDGGSASLLAGLLHLGIARSSDGGASWSLANDGLQATLLTHLAVSPAFAEDRTLFVAGGEGGVLISRDGGANWTSHTIDPDETPVSALAVSRRYAEDRTVFAATAGGLWRSLDGGEQWAHVTSAPLPAPTVLASVLSTDERASVFAGGTNGALMRTDDGGRSWRQPGRIEGAAVGPVPSRFETIALLASPLYARNRTLYAATAQPHQPDAAMLRLWRSTDGGRHWTSLLDVTGPPLLPIASPPAAGGDIVLVGVGDRVVRPAPHMREVRGGVRRPIWQEARLGPDVSSISALASAPDGRIAYAATNAGIYRSADEGRTFAAWSDGLDGSGVVALAISPARDDGWQVFALGLGGALWTREDGA
ncbi:MAG: hypothetical protein IT305_24205 [Chloroflexi bacterium]|nr:hypothetical protein [Chloroflexota bacterium]